MNRQLTLLSLTILIFIATGSQADVYVTINPNECSSCIGSLRNIRQLDPSMPVYFIMEEKYKNDSALVVENLYLKEFHAQYLWSDSLYNKYAKNAGLSTFCFIQDDNEHAVSFPLKLLSSDNIQMFNRMSKKNDTITTGSIIDHMASAEIFSYGTNLLLCNKLRNELCSYDIAENKLNYKIEYSDSLLEAAYESVFGKEMALKNAGLLKKWQVPKPIEIQAFWAVGDNCYTIVKYRYADTANGQEMVKHFFMLNTFNNGACKNMTSIQDVFRENSDDYFFFPALHIWNNQLLGPAIKFTNSDSARYFLARFKVQNNLIIKDKFLPYTLPPVYENYNYGITVFYNQYFALPLEDKIYNLNNSSVIEINRFPKENYADVLKPPKMFVESFKLNKDFVWLLYSNEEERKYYFLKYNRGTREIVFDKPCDLSGNYTPVISDFNFNSLIYKSRDRIIISDYSR